MTQKHYKNQYTPVLALCFDDENNIPKDVLEYVQDQWCGENMNFCQNEKEMDNEVRFLIYKFMTLGSSKRSTEIFRYLEKEGILPDFNDHSWKNPTDGHSLIYYMLVTRRSDSILKYLAEQGLDISQKDGCTGYNSIKIMMDAYNPGSSQIIRNYQLNGRKKELEVSLQQIKEEMSAMREMMNAMKMENQNCTDTHFPHKKSRWS